MTLCSVSQQRTSQIDYVNKWDLSGDIRSIQEEILKELSDLIGFRITCYFMDDEEDIYRGLAACLMPSGC